jgi:hypothetical protein
MPQMPRPHTKSVSTKNCTTLWKYFDQQIDNFRFHLRHAVKKLDQAEIMLSEQMKEMREEGFWKKTESLFGEVFALIHNTKGMVVKANAHLDIIEDTVKTIDQAKVSPYDKRQVVKMDLGTASVQRAMAMAEGCIRGVNKQL